MLTPGFDEPVPPMVGTFTEGWASANEAIMGAPPVSGTYEAANRGVWFPLYVPTVCVAKRMWWANGGTVNVSYNVEAGIYLDGGYKPGAKLATVGAFQGTLNEVQFADLGQVFGFSHGTPSSSSTDATSYSTVSATYTAGRLYTITVENAHGTSASAVNSITGTGITFTSRATTLYNSNLNRVSVWTAVPSGDTTTQLTIDFNAVTQLGCAWQVMEWTGVDTTTDHGVVQTATNTGNDTTPTVTLSAFGSSNNAAFGAVATASTDAITPGSGFGAPAGQSHTTPAAATKTEYAPASDTTVDATITSGQWGIVGMELKNATRTDYTLTPGLYWLYLSCSSASATFFRSASNTLANIPRKFQQASVGPGSAPATATPAEAAGNQIYLFGFSTTTIT